MDLSKLSDKELQDLQKKINQERRKNKNKQISEAREKVNAYAVKEFGYTLKELMGAKSVKRKKAPAIPARYRHPSDLSLTWTGRGLKPKWVKEWISSGKSLEDLKI